MKISTQEKQRFAKVAKMIDAMDANAPVSEYVGITASKYANDIKAYRVIKRTFTEQHIQFDSNNPQHINLFAIARSVVQTDPDFRGMNSHEQKIALGFFRKSQITAEKAREFDDVMGQVFGVIPNYGRVIQGVMNGLSAEVPILTGKHIHQLHRAIFSESGAEAMDAIKMDRVGEIAYIVRHIMNKDQQNQNNFASIAAWQANMDEKIASVAEEVRKSPEEIKQMIKAFTDEQTDVIANMMREHGMAIEEISDEVKTAMAIIAYDIQAMRQNMEKVQDREIFAANIQYSKQMFADIASIAAFSNSPKIAKFAALGQCQIKFMENISRMGEQFKVINSMISKTGAISQMMSTLGQISPYVGAVAAVVEMMGIMKRKPANDPYVDMMQQVMQMMHEYFQHIEQYMDYVKEDIKNAIVQNREIIEKSIRAMQIENNVERHFMFEQIINISSQQFQRIIAILIDVDTKDIEKMINRIRRFVNQEVHDPDMSKHSEKCRAFESLWGDVKPATAQYNGAYIDFDTPISAAIETAKASNNEAIMMGIAGEFLKTMAETREFARNMQIHTIPNMDIWTKVMNSIMSNRYAELNTINFVQTPERIISDDRFLGEMAQRAQHVTQVVQDIINNREIIFSSIAKQYKETMTDIKSNFIADFFKRMPQSEIYVIDAIEKGHIDFSSTMGISKEEFVKRMKDIEAFKTATISWKDICMHQAGIIKVSIDIDTISHSPARCGAQVEVRRHRGHTYWGFEYEPAQAEFSVTVNYQIANTINTVSRFKISCGNAKQGANDNARHPDGIAHNLQQQANRENNRGIKPIFTESAIKECKSVVDANAVHPTITPTMENQAIQYVANLRMVVEGSANAVIHQAYQDAVANVYSQDGKYGNDKANISIIKHMVTIFSTIMGISVTDMMDMSSMFSDDVMDDIADEVSGVWADDFVTCIQSQAASWREFESRIAFRSKAIADEITKTRADIQMFHRINSAIIKATQMAKYIGDIQHRFAYAAYFREHSPIEANNIWVHISSQIEHMVDEFNRMAVSINQEASVIHQTFKTMVINPVATISKMLKIEHVPNDDNHMHEWMQSQTNIIDINIKEFISVIRRMKQHMNSMDFNKAAPAIVMGRSQIGKSTFCNAMSGVKFTKKSQGEIQGDECARGIGDGQNSETSFVDIFKTENSQYLIDTPGFDGNRQIELEMAGQVSTIMATRAVSAYQKVVFMVRYADIKDRFKRQFTEDFKKIAKIYKNPKDFCDNVCIVINDVPEDIEISNIWHEIEVWRCNYIQRTNGSDTHMTACMCQMQQAIFSIFDPTNAANIAMHKEKVFSGRIVSTDEMNMETFHGDIQKVKAFVKVVQDYQNMIMQRIKEGIAKTMAYWHENPIECHTSESIITGQVPGIRDACYNVEASIVAAHATISTVTTEMHNTNRYIVGSSHDASGEVIRDIGDYQVSEQMFREISSISDVLNASAQTSQSRRNNIFEEQARRNGAASQSSFAYTI